MERPVCAVPRCGEPPTCGCDNCDRQVCRDHFYKASAACGDGGECSICHVETLRDCDEPGMAADLLAEMAAL